jgi:restriction system protein
MMTTSGSCPTAIALVLFIVNSVARRHTRALNERNNMKSMPTFDRLMNPLIEALRRLGGSGSVDEIYDKVIELESITEDILSKMHDPERSNQTEVGYRLAWARTYLKKCGLIENSSRGVWALTTKAKEISEIDPQDIARNSVLA